MCCLVKSDKIKPISSKAIQVRGKVGLLHDILILGF